MAAQLTLKGFIGGNIGLAAFTGSNIERLLTTALARQSLNEEKDFLATKLQCKDDDEKRNLTSLQNFFIDYVRNGGIDTGILNFQPLEGYIRESARMLIETVTDDHRRNYYTGIINSTQDDLLQYIRDNSSTDEARNNILCEVIGLYIADKRKTLGDLTNAFEIQLNQWPKALEKLKRIHEKKEDHKIEDKEKKELEQYILACGSENYTAKELKTWIVDMKASHDISKHLPHQLHSQIIKLHNRRNKLERLYKQKLKEIATQGTDLKHFFKDLPNKTVVRPGKKLPKAIKDEKVVPEHFCSAAQKLLREDNASASGIRVIPQVQEYYKKISEWEAAESSPPSTSESVIIGLLNFIKETSSSDFVVKAQHELLFTVMNDQRVNQSANPAEDWKWEELQEAYMLIASDISKLSKNRNTRVHYKPESCMDEALEQDEVKRLYETLIDSKFFQLAHPKLTTPTTLKKRKDMYCTYRDTVSLSAILEACKQKLGLFTYQDKNLYAENYKNLLDVQGQCEQILGELSTDIDIDNNQDLVIALLAKHYAKNIENIQDAEDRSGMAPHKLRNLRERMRTTLRVCNFQNTSDPSSLKSMLYNFKHGNTIRRKLGNQYRDHLSRQHKQWEVTIDYPSLQTIPNCPELGGTPDARVTMTREGEENRVYIAVFRRTKLAEVPSKEIINAHTKVSWLLRAFRLADLGHFVTFRGNNVRIDEIERTGIDNTQLRDLHMFYFGAMLPELALPLFPKLRQEFLPFWEDVKNACRSRVGIVEE